MPSRRIRTLNPRGRHVGATSLLFLSRPGRARRGRVRVGQDALLIFSGSSVDGVIVRTPKLMTKRSGSISAQPGPLLFLLEGKGPGVSIGPFSDLVGAAILAPERSVRVGGDGSAERIYASKAALKGTFLDTRFWEP
jgi:hypothetical protein